MYLVKLTASTLAIAAVSATAAAARDNVQITGSSTVLPYATIVAEAFGENFDFPTPVVEGGGSGAGRAKMCEGVGPNTVDIANSSSRISQRDLDTCAANGVTEMIEVRIGYDGIVFASDVNGPEFAFTPADLFNALAEQVLVDGALVANPHTQWSRVQPEPARAGHPRAVARHQARHARSLRHPRDPGGLRGHRRHGGLHGRRHGRGRGGRGLHEAAHRWPQRRHRRRLHRDAARGSTPTRTPSACSACRSTRTTPTSCTSPPWAASCRRPSTIASGEYPVSRPLYFYVKTAHLDVIPGLQEYVEFFVSDDMAGPDGPLAQYGLVSDPELAATQDDGAQPHPDGPAELI